MPKNVGKVFEEDFMKCFPSDVFTYRLPDPPQSFNRSNTLRFSWKNPCDFFAYTGKEFYALELKSVKGKFISYETDENSPTRIIHLHQIKGLKKLNSFSNIRAGFIINFRDYEKTFFVPIADFISMTKNSEKSSINIDDIEKRKCIQIKQTLKRTHYSYDIESFLKEAKYVLS